MKSSKGVFLFLSLAVVVFFCAASALAQPKAMVLNYSLLFPAPHKMGALCAEWGKEVEKRTNGMISTRMFHGGTLTPPDKAYDGAIKGISDIALVPLSYTVGRFPLTEIFDYPMAHKSSVNATKLINEYYNRFKPKEFDEVKVLYFNGSAMGGFHTNKEVKKLEDLKGMKIRSTGTNAKEVAALGGTPVALPIGETYDGLSRGVIDGILALVESLRGWKFAEVTKFTTEANSANFCIVSCIVMNKDKWNAIPADAQKIIEEINKEWSEKTAKAWDEMEQAAREGALKAGHKFIRISEGEEPRWEKALAPLFDEYIKDKKAKGLPADEVRKFCLERLKQL
jgi:TRAP-type transport system periplasmic protein